MKKSTTKLKVMRVRAMCPRADSTEITLNLTISGSPGYDRTRLPPVSTMVTYVGDSEQVYRQAVQGVDEMVTCLRELAYKSSKEGK